MPLKVLKTAIGAVLWLTCFLGCASVPPVPGDKNLLNDVMGRETTREEILLKFGEPSASFESGRILTYRIGETEGSGYYLVNRQVHWGNTKYSLVLVFDERGILRKHNLVRVR